jgi:leader peptidase (prepilin peptidase)/N-methyltransferase
VAFLVFYYILIFLFGAVIGSFLNVVILRHNSSQSILKGGSRCFLCGKKLRWHELVPILSFVIQKGKCRGCGSKNSIQYPLIEITTGLLYLLIFNFQFSIFNEFSMDLIFNTIYLWLLTSLLIVIAVYDLRHMIIPNKIVWFFSGGSFFKFI